MVGSRCLAKVSEEEDDMNEKTSRVFAGWLVLTSDEQKELQKAVQQYYDSSDFRKKEIRESMRDRATKMETGPLGKGCPCCGH